MGIWLHLVMPTVGFDRPNGQERAFSRIQSESWIFTTWSRLYFEYSKSSLLRQRHSTLWGTRNQQPHGEPATWQSSSTDRRSICRSPIGILSYKLHLTVVKVPNSGYSTLTFYLGTHIWIVSLVLHRIQEEPWRQRVVEVHRCLHIKPFCLLAFHSQILLLLYHVHLHLRHFILNLTKCIRKPVLLNPLEFKFVATWDNIHLKLPIHNS